MNIAIIPGLLYDDDFKYFDENTYKALQGVLNDVIAKMIKTYIDNPAADKELVSVIKDMIGDSVISYTLHLEFENRKIFDLLKTLQPDTIQQTDAEYKASILEQLEYVYNNVERIITVIPARTNKAFTTWKAELSKVEARMRQNGAFWKVPDMFKRLQVNSELFYSAREKDRNLPTSVILSRKDRWLLALRAVQWDNYCNSHSVSIDQWTSF